MQASPASKGLKVPSFMIHPFQRPFRYELLLKGWNIMYHRGKFLSLLVYYVEYIKHLPKDHPDLINAKGKKISCSILGSLI